MKNVVKVYVLVLFLMTSIAANASGLTEDSVKALIAKVDKAVITLNSSEISDLLSNNVVIIMNINMQGKDHVMKPNKQEYISMLKEGWATYTNYTYKKSNTIIKIKGETATVTANIKESMTVQGQDISGETKEEVTIKLVDGKPLVTKVVGYSKM